ncbi:hypothetical protein ACLOJK_023977, partial [Asimina triloba]
MIPELSGGDAGIRVYNLSGQFMDIPAVTEEELVGAETSDVRATPQVTSMPGGGHKVDLVLELVVNMMHDMREFIARQQQVRVITPPIVQPRQAQEEIVEQVEAQTSRVGHEIRRRELEGLDIKTFQDLRPPMYS